jgi:Carboxypeptidase regulatory-like domain
MCERLCWDEIKLRPRNISSLQRNALSHYLAAGASAQTSDEITGLVTDSSGAAVSGASVTVMNKATGATRKVATNKQGLFLQPT